MSSIAPPIRPAVDPGPPPVAPNLADPTTRLRLTPAAIDGFWKLAEIWRSGSAGEPHPWPSWDRNGPRIAIRTLPTELFRRLFVSSY
jgi:hypothetical protein